MPDWVKKPVVFIGLMASGKSAVGRAFAARHGLRFVDTDQLIVDRYGPIPEIFAEQGESGFRRLEADTVSAVLAGNPSQLVVSPGGGAVLNPGTQKLLADCRVVYLDTDLATVLPRISKDRGRPLLASDPVGNWLEMHAQRHSIYLDLADVVLQARGHSISELADLLEVELKILSTNTHRDNQRTTPNGQ